jgi:hypothetical protein
MNQRYQTMEISHCSPYMFQWHLHGPWYFHRTWALIIVKSEHAVVNIIMNVLFWSLSYLFLKWKPRLLLVSVQFDGIDLNLNRHLLIMVLPESSTSLQKLSKKHWKNMLKMNPTWTCLQVDRLGTLAWPSVMMGVFPYVLGTYCHQPYTLNS